MTERRALVDLTTIKLTYYEKAKTTFAFLKGKIHFIGMTPIIHITRQLRISNFSHEPIQKNIFLHQRMLTNAITPSFIGSLKF